LKHGYNNDEHKEDQKHFFNPNQKYNMQLHLNLAVPHLENRGKMFVVCLTLLDSSQNTVSSGGSDDNIGERCIVSAISPKSVYAKFLDFVLRYPIQAVCNVFEQSSLCLGLAMTTELNYWTKVTFHHEFEYLSQYSAVTAIIKIKDVQIEPLEATFTIHESNLLLWKDPILYLMTNHSNITCLITVLTISIPALILILMAWDRLTKPRIIKQACSVGIADHCDSYISSPAMDPTNPPSNISRCSEKGSNTSSRYDQARQRLIAVKNKSKYPSHNQNESTFDEKVRTRIASQVENIPNMKRIKETCYLKENTNDYDLETNTGSTSGIRLGTTDVDIKSSVPSMETVNNTNDGPMVINTMQDSIQNHIEYNLDGGSNLSSCIEAEKDHVNVESMVSPSTEISDAVLRRRKET
jgi:hypothetical protein